MKNLLCARTACSLGIGLLMAGLLTACGGGETQSSGSNSGSGTSGGSGGTGSVGSGGGTVVTGPVGPGGGTVVTGPVGPGGGTTPTVDPPPVVPAPWTFSITGIAGRGVRLEWPRVEGATEYLVSLESDEEFGSAIRNSVALDASTTSFTEVSRPLLPLLIGTAYRVTYCLPSVGCPASHRVSRRVAEGAGVGTDHFAAAIEKKSYEGLAGSRFGRVLAMSGDGLWLAVGLPGASAARGEVHVYRLDVAATRRWELYQVVALPNPESGDEFGYSVSISADGARLAVGVPGEDSVGSGVNPAAAAGVVLNSGAAVLYARGASGYGLQSIFKAVNPGTGDRFGESVALSGEGSMLAVGAPQEDGAAQGVHGVEPGNPALAEVPVNTAADRGAVYVYRRGAGVDSWAPLHYLKPVGSLESDTRFGHAVSISASGNTVAVGMPGGSWLGTSGVVAAGLVQLFGGLGFTTPGSDAGGGEWSHLSTIAPVSNAGGNLEEKFGSALSLDATGFGLAVGYPGRTVAGLTRAGAVNVFLRGAAGQSWTESADLTSPRPAAFSRFGGSVRIDNHRLLVGAAEDDGLLQGIHLPESLDLPGLPARETGAAYYFLQSASGTDWRFGARLKAPSPVQDEFFGSGVAMDHQGERIAVGGAGLGPSGSRPGPAIYLY